MLRQLVRNGDYKVVNLEPPRPLTNTFDTLRGAVRKEIFRSIFIKLFKLERYFDIVAQIGSAQIISLTVSQSGNPISSVIFPEENKELGLHFNDSPLQTYEMLSLKATSTQLCMSAS